jgi:hypothetical protein
MKFVEHLTHEVRRIPLLGSWVNRGRKRVGALTRTWTL